MHDAPLQPRERALAEGFESLGDAELLGILLGTGAAGRPVARVATDLLGDAGGLEGLASLGTRAIASHPAVGVAKAARIGAGIELGRRLVARSTTELRPDVSCSERVADWARGRLTHLDHEQIWVLALDGRNGLRAARRVAEGGLHGCSIAARDVLRAALREAASAFVLVHNHPGGDPTPSHEDIELTRAIARAAAVIGTPLVDHVIVAGGRYASLFDLGLVAGG